MFESWLWPLTSYRALANIFKPSEPQFYFTCKMGPQYLLYFVVIRIKEKTNIKHLAPNPQWVLNKCESIPLAYTLKGHSGIKASYMLICIILT